MALALPREEAVSEATHILRWLYQHPDMYNIILWMGEAESALAQGLAFSPATPKDISTLETSIARLQRWVQAGEVVPCRSCLYPIIRFPGDVEVSWPTFEKHDCEPLREPPSPRPRASISGTFS